jgi:dihydrolipoamide dehydrogenase
MKKYDVIIIGGGPAGYVAAIRSSQLGKKTAIVEANHLGGICLNWGCIPTKSLLQNAHVLDVINNADKFGIEVNGISVNWEKMMKRSRDVAKRLSKGIEYLIKKNQVDYIPAHGRLIDSSHIESTNIEGQKTQLKADKIIIATGARPKLFKGMEPDRKQILTYKEIMILKKQPKSLAIIGAGAIGVEFAHFYQSFGTEVTLIESLPNILPIEDEAISKELEKLFNKRKMNIYTGSQVKNITKGPSKVIVQLESGEVVEAEKALISVGVQGNIENIGLEECNISIDKGWIKVNKFMETSLPNLYAVGDVVGPPWLAHVASAEGITAAEHLAGIKTESMQYNNIPGCTYCHPEVASVGLTEKKALEEGYEIKVGKFPFKGLGRAMAIGETDGFVKIIYDAKYGEMLGCHIIGADATNLITEAVIARNLETTHHEVLKTIHPHPTLSEAIMEATADALGEAIHI